MDIPIVTHLSDLNGDFANVLAHCVLMRAGGQQAFTPKEISDVTHNYEGIRLSWDCETQSLVLTLQPRSMEEANDRSGFQGPCHPAL